MASLIILDLDGTLYNFDGDDSVNFSSSRFYREIKERGYRFLMKKLSKNRKEAEKVYEDIKKEFAGEVSIGLEAKFGIDRYEWFKNTWNLNPADFIEQKDLLPLVKSLDGTIAILTAAPRVWADSVLRYLNLSEYIPNLFTGEPNVRKPNPLAFRRVCDYFYVSPNECVSVGDQIHSDILPAKVLGMKTVLVRAKSSETDYSIDRLEELPKILRMIK
jgi:FMN phosphatase YigB (HAD superfamily)